MSQAPYRIAQAVPSTRRVEAEERIGRCDAKLGALAQLFIPLELRERIEGLRSAGETVDDEAKVTLANALDDALTIVEEREAVLRYLSDEHPHGPPIHDLWGLVGTETAAASAVRAAKDAAGSLDRNGEVTLTGPRVTARFRADGTPVLWSIHLGSEVVLGGKVEAFSTSSHWMGTSAPPELPAVFIRREGVTDTVLKALRLRTETLIEDESFDSAFFIENGDRDFVRALFTPRLRDAFLARAEVGDFTFLFQDGDASLAWRTGLGASVVHAHVCRLSVELLVALREALGRLQLVRTANAEGHT